MTDSQALLKTPLFQMHVDVGARMVPFAGYEMPVQYPPGILKEHLHTRAAAGLFDVSHMGQAKLSGPNVAQALEQLVPSDMLGLASGTQRYTVLLNEHGGVIDDLMVARDGNDFYVVVNASCKVKDFAHMRARLPASITLQEFPDAALLALQGPQAIDVLARIEPSVKSMKFMDFAHKKIGGVECRITRSGYTGEDGFEISVPGANAASFAEVLLKDERVAWIGLGARDSLRMEAGLCLYGHELNEEITPVEAGISWVITRNRRAGGERAGGYPGAAQIEKQLGGVVAQRKIALLVEGRAPVREGSDIVLADSGEKIGQVCSGGFAPTLSRPIAMAFVAAEHINAKLCAMVRGKPLAVTQTTLPFVPHRYFRG